MMQAALAYPEPSAAQKKLYQTHKGSVTSKSSQDIFLKLDKAKIPKKGYILSSKNSPSKKSAYIRSGRSSPTRGLDKSRSRGNDDFYEQQMQDMEKRLRTRGVMFDTLVRWSIGQTSFKRNSNFPVFIGQDNAKRKQARKSRESYLFNLTKTAPRDRADPKQPQSLTQELNTYKHEYQRLK